MVELRTGGVGRSGSGVVGACARGKRFSPIRMAVHNRPRSGSGARTCAGGRPTQLGSRPELDLAERSPVRKGRRVRWNDPAVEPLRSKLGDQQYAWLVAGPNLAWGAEAVVILFDVSGLDPEAAMQTRLRTSMRIPAWCCRGRGFVATRRPGG